jgi:uncharacterized protein (DUF4213/DUF364 family)
MSLLDSIISGLPDSDASVEEVVGGPHAVMIASSSCGLAEAGPEPAGGAGSSRFVGRPMDDMFHMASSVDRLEAGLGVAAVNAVLSGAIEKLGFQAYGIPRAGGKSVGLVGDFAFASQLEGLAAEVIRIDIEQAESLLPRVDIAILPGYTVVDHSLERLLTASASCYTIVFGPTTPLSPALFEYGADQLVGAKVENREEVARWIRDGARDLMACPGLRSVVLRKP